MADLGTQTALRESVLWARSFVDWDPVHGEVSCKQGGDLPLHKNAEILTGFEELMDNARGMVKLADIRKLPVKESWMAGFLPQLKPFVRQLWASLYKDRSDDEEELVYKRQVWPASTWLRKFHQEHQQVLVRHLYMADRLLDGVVLEVDASTTGGGATCGVGARRAALRNPPVAFVVTKWTKEDEELLGTQRGDPAHQATCEAFMVLLAIHHFVTAEVRRRIVLATPWGSGSEWSGSAPECRESTKFPQK